MTCRDVEPLLNARLDNELDISGLAEVDRHLAECRVCAGQYAALERLHQEIGTADLAYLPSRAFEQKITAKLPRSEPAGSFAWSGWWRGASIVAAAAIAVALVFVYVPRVTVPATTDISAEILDNHLRALQPDHLVDIPSSDQHSVKPWFQGKTSFSPPTPDLTNQGFLLIGGRLEVIHQQPAAAIVYKRRQHVISLYVAASGGPNSEVEVRDMQGYHLLHWSQSGIGYWAVSDVATADLREFADLIRGG